MNSLRSHRAAARQILINVGLREEEADAFLDRLADENRAGRLAPKAATNGLIELVKTKFSGHKATATRATEEDWQHIIQIDWAGAKLPRQPKDEKPLLAALKRQEQRHGTLDGRVAILLDGIGMYLDGRGYHGRAIWHRRQALKVSRQVNGPVHESTGAAHSNLGVSLFAQGEYTESDTHLFQGRRILLDCLGNRHLTTAGAVYNVFYSLHAQGRFQRLSLRF